MKKLLFIHVPKTSGTTLKLFFKRVIPDFFVQANSARQLEEGDPQVGPVRDLDDIVRILTAHGGLALHVDSSFGNVRKTGDFRSLAYHVFEPRNFDFFKQFTIITMFRDPFRSFLSSYAFVKRSKEQDSGFLPDLDLESVASFLEASHDDAVLHFLLEPELATRRSFGRDDLERVEARISDYPIHVGIYERYRESVEYFARVLGLEFGEEDLPSFNVGAGPPETSPELRAAFLERNGLDIELYAFAARLLGERLRSTS